MLNSLRAVPSDELATITVQRQRCTLSRTNFLLSLTRDNRYKMAIHYRVFWSSVQLSLTKSNPSRLQNSDTYYLCFQASAAMLMTSAFFWGIMQRRMVIVLGLLDPWKRERYVVPKRRYTITIRRCVIPQKSANLIYYLAHNMIRTRI
jgi:hypothetical protein